MYLIGFEISWWCFSCRYDVENARNQSTGSLATGSQRHLDVLSSINWTPALCNQATTAQIVVEEIHSVINRLFSGHVLKPGIQRESNIGQGVKLLFQTSL